MATAQENLQTTIDNLAAALATESANPKPSYSINGQQVSYTEWRTATIQQIRELNSLIGELDDPFEIVSPGIT